MTDISVVNVFSPLVRQTPGMQGSQPGERILSDWTVSRQAHEPRWLPSSPPLRYSLTSSHSSPSVGARREMMYDGSHMLQAQVLTHSGTLEEQTELEEAVSLC